MDGVGSVKLVPRLFTEPPTMVCGTLVGKQYLESQLIKVRSFDRQ